MVHVHFRFNHCRTLKDSFQNLSTSINPICHSKKVLILYDVYKDLQIELYTVHSCRVYQELDTQPNGLCYVLLIQIQ